MKVIRYNQALFKKLLYFRFIKAKNVKLRKIRANKSDLIFRFELHGGFLAEYYVTQEDALHILKQNKLKMIYADNDCFVLSLQYSVYCIIKS